MPIYNAVRNADIAPAHPGAVLADALADFDISKTAIALRLGISRNQLHAILAARKPITPDTAVRIGKLMGNGPGLWLRMQASFDAWHAERDIDVSSITTLEAR